MDKTFSQHFQSLMDPKERDELNRQTAEAENTIVNGLNKMGRKYGLNDDPRLAPFLEMVKASAIGSYRSGVMLRAALHHYRAMEDQEGRTSEVMEGRELTEEKMFSFMMDATVKQCLNALTASPLICCGGHTADIYGNFINALSQAMEPVFEAGGYELKVMEPGDTIPDEPGVVNPLEVAGLMAGKGETRH